MVSMFTRSLFGLLMALVFIVVVGVSPALADTHTVLPNGYFAITSSSASAIVPPGTTAAAIPLSGGSGGSASSSGHRTASIKTTIHSFLGAAIVDFKTSSNWSWKGRVVTAHSWNEPVVTRRGGGLTITYSKPDYGQHGWRSYGGKAHGCWYQSVTVTITESVLKIGILGQWQITHEYWLHGNGTYRWHSNY
jgi:hypothetical protein